MWVVERSREKKLVKRDIILLYSLKSRKHIYLKVKYKVKKHGQVHNIK